MSDLTLELFVEEAANYLELATACDKTLREVQNGYGRVLKENSEHPFWQILTPMLEELLVTQAEDDV